jgi:hypothetical protein
MLRPERSHVPSAGCLNVPGTVCVNKGTRIIASPTHDPSIIGSWSFDDAEAHDASHYHNAFMDAPPAGPEKGGKGYSGYFNGETSYHIIHQPQYEAREFSISFWIFVIGEPLTGFRTIFHKGNGRSEFTPTVMLWPHTNRLHVVVSTNVQFNEALDSTGVAQIRRWNHVVITFSGQLLQLYFNGALDAQQILRGSMKQNRESIQVGKDPTHPGTEMYLDDFRIYSRVLYSMLTSPMSISRLEEDIAAMIGNQGVGLAGPDYAHLGCESCNFVSALSSCRDHYHLCSLKELYSGAYHVARIMGWIR